ncbi:fibronectin type III domain-containing protein [Flavobacterium psychroterrae]|uniref:Fibronectin type III domain-containing protein n=1 Tax=Flavobacterium psychroterrae TaxID=2133767 RepID=A0ABS5PFE6_9FLAO|nr:fibronectin type III domain-containing protein [Flavobacterium psychroterrae]MBS7233028.1 fibronectin type III domain-containing protein [Flavobacterium psychroterrae]
MKNFFKNIILFILFPLLGLGGFGSAAYAQLYPVQLTPVFNSPYSIKLTDYVTSMDTKMQLLINPTDIAIAQRQVRLKLYIQGNGLNVQSSDFIQGQRPIFINGGELQTLTNTDIAALFRLENLQGISPAQYANGLPEGMYNFCFEMYDFVTNQKISQKSCASLYLILNDPPLLNTPQKNEQIASTEFPNILFTWTPRQINATNVSYKFELKQLIDPTLDPQFAFQMSPILYEETLFSTALLYNLSMPILTPGLRYAWRVRAISTTGLSENAVFKNDGYSEIYSFKYTASCATPTFLLSEAQNSKSVKITWEGTPEHTRYQVQYKKQDVRNAQWFSTNSLNTQSLITNLEPGVTYQFRVGSSCDPAADGVQSFTYSGVSTFTTPTQTNGVPAYNCGITPEINIQNQKPLTNLIQSETFKAGDFPVTILELKGENSPYSGRGYIIVPYLADTKIAVEFNSIVINTDYQLISGVVETSYNPDWKNITDVEDFTGEGQGGQIEETVPFIIKDIVINANGDILVNGFDGQQVTIPGGKDTVITDSGGVDEKGNKIPPKVYNVDSAGNGSNQGTEFAQGGKPIPENTDGVDKTGQATAFTAKGISIAFTGNGSKYAFDVMPEKATDALQKLYKKVGNVALPYKAVLNGDTDTLLATVNVTDSNIQLDSIVFKTQNGAKIDFKRNDKVFVLTVKGTLSYAEEQILATVKQGKKWQVIGAFMLVNISPKEVNVALVPTDDVSEKKLDAVIASTKSIYDKVGIKINFKKEGVLENFESVVPNSVDKIKTEKNTLTSTYSTVQQNINALYKGDGNSYVLFITDKKSSTGQEGYMRLNGQFGYVFTPPSGVGGTKTPAHELGHGIFKLEHPFDTYKTSESSTDLLMDYSSGTILNHQDWKQINDPVFKLYAFQSQASGEFADGYVVSPNFEVFSIGSERSKVDRNTYSSNDVRTNDGTIPGFVFNGNSYWWKDVEYINQSGSYPLKKVTNLKSISNKWLYLFFNKDNECGKTTYVTVLVSDYLDSNKTLKEFMLTYKDSKTKKTIICNDPQAKEWNESSKGKEVLSVVNVNDQNIKIIRDCGTDAYYQKSLFTYNNDIKTWGQVTVMNLDHNLKENSKNKSGDDLKLISLGGLKYINPSQQYNGNPIFEPKYIEELNNKLAYLEVSSGIQLHINFVEITCTFTQEEGDRFAKNIFENSNISKAKGIYVLVVRNMNAQNVLEWKTYFAYGTEISDSIKANANNLLKINDDNKFKNFGQSLIQFYKTVPKKQLQYIYEIELATDEEKNADVEFKFITKNINGKVAVTDNQIGNAIEAKYFFKDTQTNITKPLNVTIGLKELKEEFVSEQGLNLALVYADEFAGWKLQRKDIDKNNLAGSDDIRVKIVDCKFTLNQSCNGETIDKALLVAGIASMPFGNVAVVIDGLAIVYYASTGQTDIALMYAAGYALGPTLLTAAKLVERFVVFSEKFYLASKFSRLVNETVVTDAKVLEFLNKPVSATNHEFLFLDPELGYAFIKAEKNQILAGYVKVVNNSNEFYVLELKTGNHILSSKYENPTTEELQNAFKELSLSRVKKITTTDELIEFLDNVTESTTVSDLEVRGIKSFFRGTNRSKLDGSLFPGSTNAQGGGMSVSTDPIKGTIFSIESATKNGGYKGILQMGTPNDLRNISLSAPNRRIELELEIVFNTSADNFGKTAKIEISVENARKLVKEIYGIDLPRTLTRDEANEALKKWPASSLDKSFEFYQKAIKYNEL